MNISSGLIKAYSRMGQKGAVSAIAMPELGKADDNLRVVVADCISIASLDRFYNLYPEKVINVGIAEQNMIGVAAGVSSEDRRTVFAFTYAEFIVVRALEQIRINLAYQKFNVKLVGFAGGFSMGSLGVSHWATEDIAFIRALPNMTILSAADSLEAIKMTIAAASIDGPVYIRLSGGLNCPIVYESDFDYTVGKAITLREGKYIAIVATGLMVYESLRAADLLEREGITCTVVDMHTIKPLDTKTLHELFSSHILVVTVEEHSVIGGLGSAVAEDRVGKADKARQDVIGVKDAYSNSGTPDYLWEQNGLKAEQIADRIKKEWENCNTLTSVRRGVEEGSISNRRSSVIGSPSCS